MSVSEIKIKVSELLQQDGPLWINLIHRKIGCHLSKLVMALDELKKEGKIHTTGREITDEEIKRMMVMQYERS